MLYKNTYCDNIFLQHVSNIAGNSQNMKLFPYLTDIVPISCDLRDFCISTQIKSDTIKLFFNCIYFDSLINKTKCP